MPTPQDVLIGPALPRVRGGTAVVTGAGSGIGRAVAERLRDAGFTVLGTSRNPAGVVDAPAGIELLPLDLAEPDSVRECAAEIARRGPVAVLVANAGESQFGALEDIPDAEIERLFRVNLLGHVALLRALLPAMRTAGRGRVVMVGSMLGSFPLAHRSTYVATKAAMHAMASALRGELAPFGIGVTTVEPGSAATGISTRRTIHVPDDSAYAGAARTVLAALDANEAAGVGAGQVAEVVVRAVRARRPPAYRAIGSGAPVTTLLRRVMPEQTLLHLIARRHGV